MTKRQDGKTTGIRIRDVKSTSGIRALSEILNEDNDEPGAPDAIIDSKYREYKRSLLKKIKITKGINASRKMGSSSFIFYSFVNPKSKKGTGCFFLIPLAPMLFHGLL